MQETRSLLQYRIARQSAQFYTIVDYLAGKVRKNYASDKGKPY